MSLATVRLLPDRDFVEMLRNPTRSTEVKVWLKKNPDWFLKWRGEQGECALHWAVYMDLAVVLELLQVGLDLNQTDDDASTPLDWVHLRWSLAVEGGIPGITPYNVKKITAQADRIMPELMGLGAQFQYFKEPEVVIEWSRFGLWGPLEVMCQPHWKTDAPFLVHPFWEAMEASRKHRWDEAWKDEDRWVAWLQAFNRSPLTQEKLQVLDRWPFVVEWERLRDLAWEDYKQRRDSSEYSEWVQHLILSTPKMALGEEEWLELGLASENEEGFDLSLDNPSELEGQIKEPLSEPWSHHERQFWTLIWKHEAGERLKKVKG